MKFAVYLPGLERKELKPAATKNARQLWAIENAQLEIDCEAKPINRHLALMRVYLACDASYNRLAQYIDFLIEHNIL